MQVAKRIHVEHVGETGGQAEILEETREHMPWVTLHDPSEPSNSDIGSATHVKERRDKVDAKCGNDSCN